MEQATNTIMAYGTFWALVPALVAIILALVSKEVYSSLFLGVIVGGLLLCQGTGSGFFDAVFKNGLIAKVADPYNVGILVFLVMSEMEADTLSEEMIPLGFSRVEVKLARETGSL